MLTISGVCIGVNTYTPTNSQNTFRTVDLEGFRISLPPTLPFPAIGAYVGYEGIVKVDAKGHSKLQAVSSVDVTSG